VLVLTSKEEDSHAEGGGSPARLDDPAENIELPDQNAGYNSDWRDCECLWGDRSPVMVVLYPFTPWE
jgi:hypothetical protein